MKVETLGQLYDLLEQMKTLKEDIEYLKDEKKQESKLMHARYELRELDSMELGLFDYDEKNLLLKTVDVLLDNGMENK